MDKVTSNSLLSICIPTYNRGEQLETIVELMLPVCEKNAIGIYISDNASTDNTESIVKKLCEKSDLIHYHRHKENIGPDNNFEYVLKSTDTEYRWLMSDTCYFDDIDNLIEEISNSSYDVYVLNGLGLRVKNLPKSKTTYTNSVDAMKEIGWHLSWISCMIYRKSVVEEMDFNRYKNSGFNQTALVFDTTAGRECLIRFNPNIKVRNLQLKKNDSGWEWHIFEVFCKRWYLFVMSLPLYYPFEAKEKMYKEGYGKSASFRILTQMKRRRDGKWGLKDYIKYYPFIRLVANHKFITFLLAVTPRFIFQVESALFHLIKPIAKPFWYIYKKKYLSKYY